MSLLHNELKLRKTCVGPNLVDEKGFMQNESFIFQHLIIEISEKLHQTVTLIRSTSHAEHANCMRMFCQINRFEAERTKATLIVQ